MKQIVAFALFALLLFALTTVGQEPVKVIDHAKFMVVKGKLPVGWSTTLKMSTAQKERMYAVSAEFQKKIADIRHQEYVALYKMLDDHQKAYLKSKVID